MNNIINDSNFFGVYQNTIAKQDNNIDTLSITFYENIFKLGFDNTTPFYNIAKTIIIPDQLDPNMFEIIKPQPNDTWTNLSYIYYDKIDLWWLIALINNVYNPFEMPEYLKIIKPEYVDLILSNIQSQLQ